MTENMSCMQKLYDHFMEELADAEHYYELATEHKRKNSNLAKTFVTIAEDEMRHATMLEKEIVNIVTNAGEGDTNERMIHSFMAKASHDAWVRAKAAKARYEA